MTELSKSINYNCIELFVLELSVGLLKANIEVEKRVKRVATSESDSPI